MVRLPFISTLTPNSATAEISSTVWVWTGPFDRLLKIGKVMRGEVEPPDLLVVESSLSGGNTASNELDWPSLDECRPLLTRHVGASRHFDTRQREISYYNWESLVLRIIAPAGIVSFILFALSLVHAMWLLSQRAKQAREVSPLLTPTSANRVIAPNSEAPPIPPSPLS